MSTRSPPNRLESLEAAVLSLPPLRASHDTAPVACVDGAVMVCHGDAGENVVEERPNDDARDGGGRGSGVEMT